MLFTLAGLTCNRVTFAVEDPLVIVNEDRLEDLGIGQPWTTHGVDVGGGADYDGSLEVINGSFVNNPNWTNIGEFKVGVLPFVEPSGSTETYGGVALYSGTYLVNSGQTTIGQGYNKVGYFLVDEGAVWVNDGPVFVGNGGGGGGNGVLHTLEIVGSATVTNSPAGIGIGDGTTAYLNVHGRHAFLSVNDFSNGTMDIGSSGGIGAMDITDGGVVNNTWAFVGTSPGFFGAQSNGDVYIAGTTAYDNETDPDPNIEGDSIWNVGDNEYGTGGGYLSVGEYGGYGNVEVDNRGHVNAWRLLMGQGGGEGHITVNTGGKLEVLTTITMWDGSTIDLTGGGRALVGQGFISQVQDGTMRIGFGGALLGDGTIIGNVELLGGTIKPGHSPGTITIDGNLILDADSEIEVQVGGTGSGQFDQINVLGNTTLGGTVKLVFLPGFNPQAGDALSLDIFLNHAGIQGGFTALSVEGLSPNLAAILDLDQLASGQPLDITIASVPEPASIVLLSVAIGFGLTRRQKRLIA